MRLYGKRFVKRAFERFQMRTAETRDGILWYIDEEDRVCRVKIQGSDELIVAHYPRNWSKTPHWLKIGNAVRITHRGGVRGLIEVVSDGRAIPTAIEGGTARPDPDPGADAVLSGCKVEEIVPNDMKVNVTPGFFRLNGVIYSLGSLGASGIVMDDPAPMTMGETYVMGQYIGYLDIDVAPASGYYRYDIIVVDEDSNISVVKGTEVTSDPEFPSTPTDNLLLAWILLYPGMTVVTDSDINKLWTEPTITNLELVYSPDQDVQFNQYSPPTVFVRCYMVDQYGNYYNAPSLQYMTLTKLIGSGNFCASPVSDACETYTVGTYCQWTWTWPSTKLNGTYQDDAEHSPSFQVTVEDSYLKITGALYLYDLSGNYIV